METFAWPSKSLTNLMSFVTSYKLVAKLYRRIWGLAPVFLTQFQKFFSLTLLLLERRIPFFSALLPVSPSLTLVSVNVGLF